jgi:hypothetical protein
MNPGNQASLPMVPIPVEAFLQPGPPLDKRLCATSLS